jgi:protein-S-isoprenylcysteine O-methyltransferase Ste14
VQKLLVQLAVQTAVTIAVMGTFLFAGAGTWRWMQAWIFLALFAAGSVLAGAFLLLRDPGLLASRLGGPVQKGQPLWDRLFLLCTVIGWCLWLALMAADSQRWHFSHVPVWLEVAGAVSIAAGFLAVIPVFAANSFASPTVHVQSGQRVIDTGPYAIVRHPMYAGALLHFIGIPLLLGSAYGLIGTALITLAMARRAVGEERTLQRELAGYSDYMQRVRWRLIPGVW